MKKFMRPLLVLLAVLFSGENAHAISLSFLSDFNLPTGAIDATFGGLSGLAYDPQTKTFLGLCDDRSEGADARFYSIQISPTPGAFVFNTLATTTLRREDGTPFPRAGIDPEGIALFGNERVFIASEGNAKVAPRVPPAIFEFQRDGKLLRTLELPPKFLGMKDNGAFESLTVTPRNTTLYTATECPLVADGECANFAKGGLARVLAYRLHGSARTPAAEYAYAIDPNFQPAGATKDYWNGISEMLAFGERELLVLERGTAGTPAGVTNRIRLYAAKIDATTTNVATFDTLADRTIVPMKKKLVLDFETLVPRLDPSWRSVDNLEAMSFGPRLPNGRRTLLFLSDNNFNPAQRTQVLAFEIIE